MSFVGLKIRVSAELYSSWRLQGSTHSLPLFQGRRAARVPWLVALSSRFKASAVSRSDLSDPDPSASPFQRLW